MKQYFDWDIGARNDRRILALRKSYQWGGYGLFVATIEVLHENDGHIPRSSLPEIAYGLGTDAAGYEKFINACIAMDGLLKEDENGIYSERVLSKIAWRKGLSLSGKRGGRPRKDQEILLDPPTQGRIEPMTSPAMPGESPVSEQPEFVSAMIIGNIAELKECFGQQWLEMAGMKKGADPKEFTEFVKAWVTNKEASGDYFYTKTKLRSYLLSDWDRRSRYSGNGSYSKPQPEKPSLKKLGQI